jgi:hypothetical protein
MSDASDAGEIGGGGGGYDFAAVGDDATSGDGRGIGMDHAPVNLLPVGIDAGLKYVKETYAHARTFGHQMGVDKCVPRGTNISAIMADVVALEAAKKWGGASAVQLYDSGYIFEHPAFVGTVCEPGEGSDRGRKVNKPGIARSATTVELLVWPHGRCDAKGELRNVMARLGLVRLDLRQSSSLPDIDKIEHKLMSANPFAAVDDGLNPANGWFRSGNDNRSPKGTTTLWREFYQVRGCDILSLFRKPSDRDVEGTFLAVFGATWYFESSNDYETRIAFAVYSLPYVSTGHGTHKWEMIRNHREAAEKAAAKMVSFISGFSAPRSSIEKRRRVRLEMTEPLAPVPPDPFKVVAPPVVLPPAGARPGFTPGPEADER